MRSVAPTRSPVIIDIGAIRGELGLSQTEFAALVDVSVRTIQACEQGWRRPSSPLQKSALLLLLTYRNGAEFGTRACWEATECEPALRDACIVHNARQGHLCWFLTGTVCRGYRLSSWMDKLSMCRDCPFFQELLLEDLPVLDH